MRKLSVFFLYCSPLLAIIEPTARSLRVHYYLYNLRNQRQFVDPIMRIKRFSQTYLPAMRKQ